MSKLARPRLDLPSEDEVCSHREHGLYPYVLWLPRLGSANFAEEARRQAKALIEAAEEEREALDWVDSHVDDLFADVEKHESR